MNIIKITGSPSVFEVNSYILIDDKTKKAAVVDPGEDAGLIMERAEQAGAKIDFILLTHGHFDHIGALSDLHNKTGVKIYVHPAEIPYMRKQDDFISSIFYNLNLVEGLEFSAVEQGDVIRLGDTKITVMHTPGHSAGSVIYIAGDSLITGDTLFNGSVGRVDGPAGSPRDMQKSIERIKGLDSDYKIFPGHGPDTTLYNEINSNIYFGRTDTLFY